jgi:DNA-binding response OmpR family regulator
MAASARTTTAPSDRVTGRLLVVDDEQRIRTLLSRVLIQAGFAVDTASTGQEAIEAARRGHYHLVVLDLMLPDLHGIAVLERLLAARADTTVLVLSAVPEIEQRVRAFDLGATDFLAKPFAIDELLARVRARLRPFVPEQSTDESVAISEGVWLNTQAQAILSGGRRIPLSQKEFRLISHLISRRGQPCTREELLDVVWGYQFDPGTNVVDVYVRRVRTKLRPADPIRTVRNVGYCFAEDSAPGAGGLAGVRVGQRVADVDLPG